jgi:probable rRNA maturation factor
VSARVSIFGISSKSRTYLKVRRIALFSLKALEISGEIEIIFGTSRLMKRLNMKYRHKNRSTDVLAFSYSGASHAKQNLRYFPRGQIFINRNLLKDSAKLTRLLIHAIVHIAGYDHETKTKEKEMTRMEKKIVSMLKYE